jgi:hypothetical protein
MNDNIKRLNECLWLEKIGEKDDFGFEVEFVTKSAMKKHIKSRNWENAVL